MDESRPTSDDPLPGSISDQNGEEAEPGHGGGGEAHESEQARRRRGEHGHEDGNGGGESKEGSQSTGDPRSAG